MKKAMCGWGMVVILALAGCQSGMYSSDVSVDRKDDGVSDYTVVETLDVKEYPQSMPVVVESTSTNQKGEHGLNNLLWFFTLGIVPGVSSEATTYDVTVRTPIGEKSGTCTIEASSWLGWLPIFVPYPGIADERTSNPRLPNVTLEESVRNQLVANLVSQFPKSEYANFAAKNNSPELKAQRAKESAERERLAKERAEAERVRLAKEAAERAEKQRLAMRTELYEKTVEHDLAAIKECYSKGRRYENPFLDKRTRNRDEKTDWLAKWASPRLDMTEADALAGEALLSEFGTKYLPNAYANYEKKREAVAELQQVFNEEFPQPWTIKSTDSKWNSFNKVLEKFAKTRTEFFICHDELCHYWLLSRFGVLSDKDFAQIDTQRLAVHLLPENVERARYSLLKVNPMEGKVSDFAVKYAPESNAIYQKMGRELKELNVLLAEVLKQRVKMDDVRYSRVFAAAFAKRNDLVREMNALSYQLQAWHMDHRTTEKSSEDVAKCDTAMGRQLKPFMDALPSYIKEHTLGSIIARNDFINLNGGTLYHTDNRGKEYSSTNIASFRMQRFEVTQLQWMLVMGDNPSKRKGADLPVENVSWDDCQKFIKKLNEAEGTDYRLPTVNEWEFACRAGSRGTWCKGRNGEEITDESVDKIGWFYYFDGGSSRTCKDIHPIGLKEPNLWGLYDMLGNACEWCVGEDPCLGYFERSERKFYHSYRGGGVYDGASYFRYSNVSEGSIERGPCINLGFRLAASSN